MSYQLFIEHIVPCFNCEIWNMLTCPLSLFMCSCVVVTAVLVTPDAAPAPPIIGAGMPMGLTPFNNGCKISVFKANAPYKVQFVQS